MKIKLVKCNECKENFAIDLERPDIWHCPYCDKLYAEIGGEQDD
ncbi:hypothetical protein [Lactococcus formosensis]|nr:hypothetical protein [Lactococcus formosensis]